MRYLRHTITIPEDLEVRLKRRIHGRGLSPFLALAAREKLEREKKDSLPKQLAEGYAACAREDRSLAEDWEAATADGL
jgi:hypothetical protein